MLVEERQHRQRVGHAAVKADERDRTAAAHRVDRRVKGFQAVDPGFLQHPLSDRVGHGARDLLREPAGGRAVRLHPYRVDHRVRPPTVGHLADRLGNVVVILQGQRLDPVAARHLDPLGHEVYGDDPVAAVGRDARAHLAYRAESQDRYAAALWDLGVLYRLPTGGQDVREVDKALVRHAFGLLRHLNRRGLRQGYAQELGLTTGHLSVELGESKQRCAHTLLAHLRGLALRVEPPLAHEAMPADDGKGHHHPVAGLYVCNLVSDLLDDAHRLMSEDIAFLDERA